MNATRLPASGALLGSAPLQPQGFSQCCLSTRIRRVQATAPAPAAIKPNPSSAGVVVSAPV